MPMNLPPALSPETWPFDLELLTPPVYLVGGAVRDALLGRRSHYFDLDFVMLTRAVKTARKIADRTKGGFVLLVMVFVISSFLDNIAACTDLVRVKIRGPAFQEGRQLKNLKSWVLWFQRECMWPTFLPANTTAIGGDHG